MKDLSVLAILRAEVDRTQEEYTQSKKRFQAICKEVPSGLPHPDGTHRLQNAARAQTAAMVAYSNALQRFNELLLSGKDPDDLDAGEKSVGSRPKTSR
jgi:hypothetical protein